MQKAKKYIKSKKNKEKFGGSKKTNYSVSHSNRVQKYNFFMTYANKNVFFCYRSIKILCFFSRIAGIVCLPKRHSIIRQKVSLEMKTDIQIRGK